MLIPSTPTPPPSLLSPGCLLTYTERSFPKSAFNPWPSDDDHIFEVKYDDDVDKDHEVDDECDDRGDDADADADI